MAFATSSIHELGGRPTEPVLVVRGLKTEFVTARGVLRAVDGVDFEIGKGEVLGLVGESGCGKTVTALSIMYLVQQPPGRLAGGEIWFRGVNLLAGGEDDIRIIPRFKGPPKVVPSFHLLKRHRARMNRIRGRGISMVFQEPMSSLNPVLRIGYQVAEVLIFQRRKEICERILSRGNLADADLDLFRLGISTADVEERDRIVGQLGTRTGLSTEQFEALIDASDLSVDQRIQRLQTLARRRRIGSRWWARFLRRLDELESDHFDREWATLTRSSVGQAAADLFDPAKNPLAQTLPPLARVSPTDRAVKLYFRMSSATDSDRGAKVLSMPSESLRRGVEDVLHKASTGSFGMIFANVDSVVVAEDAVELRFKRPKEASTRTEFEYRTRQALHRTLLSIPLLRSFLMKPLEDEARRYVLELLRLVRISEPSKIYDEYPHELSGGMQQRVMIAMALAGEPALMIADEPTTALDVTTQAQILWLLKDLRKRINAAILYITHDLAVIAELSDRVAVMYAAKIVEDAPVADLFREPLHPYTQGLLESIVSMEGRLEPGAPLPTIPGMVPDLLSPPTGCRFHPRCKFAFERCRVEEPLLQVVRPSRKVACHLYDEEAASVGRR
jgi:oligopeptide/dipeptide ABC transporter ATP-binding protein